MHRHAFAAAILGASMVLPLASAQGAFVTYASRAAWLAAAGGATTQDFESVAPVTASTLGDTFNLGAFSIIIDANHGSIEIDSAGTGPVIAGAQSFFGDVHSPGGSVPQFQTLNFAAPITAFAADFAAGDAAGITLHILGDPFAISFSGTTFFGVVSDTPFSLVDIRGGATGSGFFVMDDVSFNNVPEPASLALFGASLLALGMVRRRR